MRQEERSMLEWHNDISEMRCAFNAIKKYSKLALFWMFTLLIWHDLGWIRKIKLTTIEWQSKTIRSIKCTPLIHVCLDSVRDIRECAWKFLTLNVLPKIQSEYSWIFNEPQKSHFMCIYKNSIDSIRLRRNSLEIISR